MLVGSAGVLGPQATSLAALAMPLQLISSMGPAVALSEEDREMLGSVRYVLDVLGHAQEVSRGRGGGRGRGQGQGAGAGRRPARPAWACRLAGRRAEGRTACRTPWAGGSGRGCAALGCRLLPGCFWSAARAASRQTPPAI
jgi:hypothetical protein